MSDQGQLGASLPYKLQPKAKLALFPIISLHLITPPCGFLFGFWVVFFCLHVKKLLVDGTHLSFVISGLCWKIIFTPT